MSFFDKLILKVCLLHTVFISDVLSEFIVLYPTAKAILPRLTTCFVYSWWESQMLWS